jgi:ADP-heptose:LPS heptosyltransferase
MKPKTIRILTWGGLGDALLITPALAALRQAHPAARIVVYCEHPFFKDLYRHNPDISRVVRVKGFRKSCYELLYDMGLLRVSVLDFKPYQPGKSYWKSGTELAGEMLGVTVSDPRIRAYTLPQEDEEARRTLAPYPAPIIINPATLGFAYKQWSHRNWEAVIRQVEAPFIQVGLRQEPLLEGAVDLRGRTSIRQTMALVKNAAGYAGVDSFVSHLAGAFAVPAVVIFGPTTPVVWGHANAVNIWKNHQVSCAPCFGVLQTAGCPYGHRCMEAVTVAEVVEAISSRILAGNPVNSFAAEQAHATHEA